MITGREILALGFPPGPHIRAMLERARTLPEGADLKAALADLAPPPVLGLREAQAVEVLAEAQTPDEEANIAAVAATMRELSRTPVVKAAVALPDACPAGPMGSITVGGVVASEAIHPGMHSADICCSVAISVYDDISPAELLDRVHRVAHFGPGGRNDFPMPDDLRKMVASDKLLSRFFDKADHHYACSGDGNHFLTCGLLKSDGRTALVSHYGSRGLGAQLYKFGMAIAERHTRKVSPETLRCNAWIDPESADGEAYWAALQIVRAWTKSSHFAIHDAVGAKVADRFWNEHNFVFRKADGLFYHAKGATPAFKGWAADATELTMVPLNMAQPILIVRGRDNPRALGFSPHGAGRNLSRSEHRRRGMGDLEAETAGIDVRFFSGIPDLSELPSGYKNAPEVRRQIEAFDLAEIVDEVIPHGSIMAGDWEAAAPWRQRRQPDQNLGE